MTMTAINFQYLAFGAGVFLHVIVYRRGEWDLAVPSLCCTYVVAQATLIFYEQLASKDGLGFVSLFLSIRNVAWISLYHITGIFLSMLIYRMALHPLRSFPGPLWARLSNFYVTMLSARRLHLFEEVESLHKEYGDFVRLGPSELSIIDPQSIEAIYSAKSPCSKGPFYNVLHPRTSLQMIRDKSEHARRRKIWDRGFNIKSLREYEPRVAKYTDQLLTHIENKEGIPIDISEWFNFYSFDVMGDLSFGKSFGMLQHGVRHYFMKALHADMTNIGYLSHLVWLFPLLKIIPGLNSAHRKFWAWCHSQVEERIKMKPDRPDVFSWILEDYSKRPKTKQSTLNLDGDAYLIVVAGSDTTAAVLTSLFYELAKSQEQISTLRSAIKDYSAKADHLNSSSLAKIPHLDAVINETLRLYPPVPSGLQRVTPPEGLLIGSTFIPGNTIVQVPLHTAFRDERSFEKPLEFIPERWTNRPELVKDASVFIPFSIGPYSCVGKQLALMEIRYVVSQIILKYDLVFATSQDQMSFLRSKRDTFTLALGQMNVVFTRV